MLGKGSATWAKREGLLNLLLLSAMAFSVWSHASVQVVPEDEAFVTYRYVRNLLEGDGLVYGTSQRAVGPTTPLGVLLLAGLQSIFSTVDVPEIAVRANAVLHVAAAFGVVQLVRVHAPSISPVAGAIFLTHPFGLARSLDGTEAMLAVACVVWTLWALARERVAVAALIAGMAVLVRPEGAVCIVLGTSYWLLEARTHAIRTFALLLLPALSWILFSMSYHTGPAAHSSPVKQQASSFAPRAQALSETLHAVDRWTTNGRLSSLRELRLVLSVNLVVAAVIGAWMGRRQFPKHWWTIPFVLVSLVGLYGIASPAMTSQQYAQVWSAWLVTLVVGLLSLARGVSAGLPSRFISTGRRLISALVVLWLVAVGVDAYRDLLANSRFPDALVDPPERWRVVEYGEAGRWIAGNSSGSTRVAAPEIGALGYASRAEMVDCGIPGEVRVLTGEVTRGVLSADCIRAAEPEYVVGLRVFLAGTVLVERWFLEAYDLVRVIPLRVPVWKSREVLVFERRR